MENLYIWVHILNLMALKYNKATLSNLEQLFKEADFTIRYEKGHFKSGYCLIHDRKVIIINKFFDDKARIENFLDILNLVKIKDNLLSERSKDFLNIIVKSYNEETKLVA